MKTNWFFFLALSGIGAAALPALATATPLVIPGIGPQSAQPVDRGPSPSGSGAYGGGFLELLMTGSAARSSAPVPPQSAYAAPPARHLAYNVPGAEPPAPALGRTIDPMFERQEVAFSGPERPGTIIIDTPQKFLFLVEPGGRALRYGIGVGRPGFAWAGVKTISRKAEWPGWTPPPEMIKRRPDLPAHMDGGPANPLGARALYLGSSLYRIHGTNEPQTIGTNVSSGCIRMMNDDVKDLYGRVRVGTKVIVM